MKLYLDCYPCMLKQVLKIASLLNLNPEQSRDVMDKALSLLADITPEDTAPHITAALYAYIASDILKTTEIFDPYRDIKIQTNTLSLEYSNRLEQMLLVAADPLFMAIQIAAAGNIIDFGAVDVGNLNIEEEIDKIPELRFGINHYSQFQQKLQNADTILIIGDNAGEIVFDKILIRQMQQISPDVKIIFAVRARPIINDATIVDADQVAMHEIAEVISSGSIYPGTVLAETTEQFQELFNSADLVIAKGQGNYETMCDSDNRNLFFLLRIKCDIIGKSVNTATGNLVLLQPHSNR